jgi:ferredoxin-NADP reductase
VTHRIGADDLRPLLGSADAVTAYVCGSAGFVEAASQLVVDLGVPAAKVRVGRFGLTG